MKIAEAFNNNPATVQMLGLCPLLAVTTSLINAVTLGLATLFVLVMSNGLIASVARFTPHTMRLPFFILIIAGFVTATEQFLSIFYFDLYEALGIYLALITTNCMIMGRAEGFAAKNPILVSMADGLVQGLGFMLVLCIIGGARELLSQAFLLSLLPPGAFILLGLLIAGQNIMEKPPLATRAAPFRKGAN